MKLDLGDIFVLACLTGNGNGNKDNPPSEGCPPAIMGVFLFFIFYFFWPFGFFGIISVLVSLWAYYQIGLYKEKFNNERYLHLILGVIGILVAIGAEVYYWHHYWYLPYLAYLEDTGRHIPFIDYFSMIYLQDS